MYTALQTRGMCTRPYWAEPSEVMRRTNPHLGGGFGAPGLQATPRIPQQLFPSPILLHGCCGISRIFYLLNLLLSLRPDFSLRRRGGGKP